jgi:hypothetical protein
MFAGSNDVWLLSPEAHAARSVLSMNMGEYLLASTTCGFFAGGACRTVSALDGTWVNVCWHQRRVASSPEAHAARLVLSMEHG